MQHCKRSACKTARIKWEDQVSAHWERGLYSTDRQTALFQILTAQTSGTSEFGEISTPLVCRTKRTGLRHRIEQIINMWKRSQLETYPNVFSSGRGSKILTSISASSSWSSTWDHLQGGNKRAGLCPGVAKGLCQAHSIDTAVLGHWRSDTTLGKVPGSSQPWRVNIA